MPIMWFISIIKINFKKQPIIRNKPVGRSLNFNYFNCYVSYIYWKIFEYAETGYLHFLITEYNNSVTSCDDISIDQFLLLFSSFRMRLLLFHLEYHCILLWLIRLMNCLKMGRRFCPKRRENTWFSLKIK